MLSPFTTNEAVLSSRIEGTQATLEEVLEFDAQAKPKHESNPDLREVLNYRHAMIEAVEFLQTRPLCLNLLLQMHATLMEGVSGQQHGRGEFRQVQNWIGRSDSTLKTAKFVPPDPVVNLNINNLFWKAFGTSQKLTLSMTRPQPQAVVR